jgi:hypothetical protein
MLKNAVPVKLISFGPANPDKIFYVIFREPPGSGFFSNVFHVLGHIWLADCLGLTPVVDMLNFPTLYNEADPIHCTGNAWEYYFDQPAGYSLEDAWQSRHVAFCDGKFPWKIYDTALAASVSRRFLHVHESVLAEVDSFQREFFRDKTILGVHIRGQEQKTAPGHPTPPRLEQMLKRAGTILSTHPVDALFLVTEEQSYLDAFRAAFGEKLLHTAAFRTYDVNAYHLQPYPRPLHMYRLGLDVRKDTLLLSRCQYLLAGGRDGVASGSNVSQMAQVLNMAGEDGGYRHVYLIWNGRNPLHPHESRAVSGNG